MKIAFVHNLAMWYRVPFFERLSELYDVDFLFLHEGNVEGLEKAKYEVLPNYFETWFKIISKVLRMPRRTRYAQHGIALGLIPRLLARDYDVIIGGDANTLPELVESLICLSIAKFKKKPFILYYGEWNSGQKNIQRKLASPAINFIIRHADAIVTYGTKSKEHSIKLGREPNKVFIVPNSSIIDVWVTKKESDDLKIHYGIENRKIVLFVGRLIRRKGVERLIRAFYKVKSDERDSCLLIIGDGGERYWLEKLCEALNIEKDVLFLGTIKNKELPRYYCTCNVFVFPGSNEPWGLVLNEAMYFGKPVIATYGVGAAYDLIKDGVNGFILPENDVDALYEAIKTIICSSELERKMGMASKRVIEEGFTYGYMVEGFKEAVEYAHEAFK